MSDMGEMFNDLRQHKKEKRAALGIECPQCKVKRPKTNASILLPSQRCRVDGYRDPRPRSLSDGFESSVGKEQP
jgi:hypothetical protein